MAKPNVITPTPKQKRARSNKLSVESIASLKPLSGLYRAGEDNRICVIVRGYGPKIPSLNGTRHGYFVEHTGGDVLFRAPHEVRTMEGEPTHLRLAYEAHEGYLAPRTDNNFQLVKSYVAHFKLCQPCTIFDGMENVISLTHVAACLAAGLGQGDEK